MAEDQDPPISIEEKLRQAWRQERRYYNTRGACRFAVWLVALLALDFLIDWGLFAKTGLTGGSGLVLLVLNVAVLAGVLWFEWLRYLKPFDPVRTSLEVEKRHPGLASLLVSYTQLEKPSSDQPNISAELVAAMREQALERARPLDFREIVDFAQLKKLATVAGVVLLLFGVFSIRWTEHVGVLFARLAGSDARYPTKTQVVSVAGDLTVRLGDPATITATAAGLLPDEGRVFTRPAEGGESWKELPMKPGAGANSFSRELKSVTEETLYYVRLGDDRSDRYRIRVVASPRVIDQELVLTYPEYMNREPGKSDRLTLEVPEGTTIAWILHCDLPVARCLVRTGEETIEADVSNDGKTVRFALTTDHPLKYTFRWTERANRFEYDDVQHAVKVVEDALPEVELQSPLSNGLATVKKTLNLEAKASDDHGLDKAWLVYSVDGSEEVRHEIHDFGGATERAISHGWKLAEDIADLKPGSQITFAVEVADYHPDRDAHRRRSATRQLTIVEPERYLEWYRAELAAQKEELKRSRAAEIVSSKVVKQIKTEEGIPE